MRPFVFLAASFVFACSGGRERSSSENDPVGARDSGVPVDLDTAGERRARTGVIFDPESVSVGDTIAGLVVRRANLSRAYDSALVGSVWFTGRVRLSGRTMKHPDHPEVRAVCFEADSASAQKVPRWMGDRRRTWFCMSNLPKALELAEPGEERDAEIVIENFATHHSYSDAVNEASLVEVIRK